MSAARVVLYHAPGCHLCERMQEQLLRLHGELGFGYEEVDISGDEELEARYREWLRASLAPDWQATHAALLLRGTIG